MRFLRPLLRWTFLLAVLAVFGAITFQFVRYRPRWTLQTSGIDTVRLSADGRHLLHHDAPGPISVWDTHEGRLLHELFTEHGVRHLQMSKGSLAAAVVFDNSLWLVDWVSGARWPLAGPQDPAELQFSDSGRLLLVRTDHDDTRLHPLGAPKPKTFVFDVQTKQRKLVAAGVCKHLSSDDRLLFLRKFPSTALSVIDIETGKTLAELPLTTQDVTFAANGKRLVAGLPAQRIGPLDDPVKPAPRLCVYELSDGPVKETPLDFERNPMRGGVITPDGRVIITWLTGRDGRLDFVDGSSGRVFSSHAVQPGGGGLSPDGSLFGFIGHPGTDGLTMFETRTGRPLWKHPGVTDVCFLPAGEVVGLCSLAFTLLDRQTGDEIDGLPGDVTLPFGAVVFGREGPLAKSTPDGRTFHLRGEQTRYRPPFLWEKWLDKWLPQFFADGRQTDVIVETATGRELFRLVEHGKRGIWLSDDGSTLLTADGEPREDYVLRVWDVHPRHAYAWAIGVAAGAWLAGWMLKRLWTKFRSRRAAQPPANTQRH